MRCIIEPSLAQSRLPPRSLIPSLSGLLLPHSRYFLHSPQTASLAAALYVLFYRRHRDEMMALCFQVYIHLVSRNKKKKQESIMRGEIYTQLVLLFPFETTTFIHT